MISEYSDRRQINLPELRLERQGHAALGVRRCCDCKEVKPLDGFYKSSKDNAGHKWRCIPCSKQYDKRHPASPGVRHKRRAAIKSAGTFTWREWKAVLMQYGNKCLRCGTSENIVIDHVIAISKGGPNTADNLQPLCRSCNSTKSAHPWDYRKQATQ